MGKEPYLINQTIYNTEIIYHNHLLIITEGIERGRRRRREREREDKKDLKLLQDATTLSWLLGNAEKVVRCRSSWRRIYRSPTIVAYLLRMD